ncbi:MAG: hypothetical protein ACRCS3_14835 [Paracoccaceae bacterium]
MTASSTIRHGRVYFDKDGVGGVAQVLFAIVDAGTNLSAVDFLVV